MALSSDNAKEQDLSHSQLYQYYDRIALPEQWRFAPEAATQLCQAEPAKALELLGKLQRYHMTHIPFENLGLHYARSPAICTDPLVVFDKVIERASNGRGGYCMEGNALLGTVLHTLGYQTYSGGGRVNQVVQPTSQEPGWKGPNYDGWNHMINFVTIGSTKYLIDVAFSSMSPTQPIPLEAGRVLENSGTMQVRLVNTTPPDSRSRASAQALWEYQIRFEPTSEWLPAYCFSEVEFFPVDYVTMSYYTSTNPNSWFTRDLVCTHMIMDEESDKVVGDLTLFRNVCKRRVHGHSEVVQVCDSEAERIKLLRESFGITLSEEECEGIRGRSSEIA